MPPFLWASFVLAREFGWTPQQVQAMTMGQVGLYLEMLDEYGTVKHGSETTA
jgi:hypothetical protein